MKKQTAAGAIVGLILVAGICFYLVDRNRPRIPPAIKTVDSISAQDSKVAINAHAKESPRSTQSTLADNPSILINELPFQNAIVRLIKSRPDWGISDDDAKKIQAKFVEIWDLRALIEVKKAKITRVSENANLVEIPAYPEEGQVLESEFKDYIAQTLGSKNVDEFEQQAIATLVGLNHQLGKYGQKLDVKEVAGEPYQYEVVRETILVNSSGESQGTALSIDNLSQNNLGMYAHQESFFPGKTKT